MAFRIDIGHLKPPRRLPDGRLVAEGYLTRAGVFRYRRADGSERLEYRPPEEVFDAEAMESFKLAPLTDDHPPKMLDAKNARRYAVGATGELLRQDGEYLAAPLVVYDEETIAKMERGKVQLSCGYHVDLVEQPGETPDGQRYDAIQRRIRGNHVAVVDVGRAGPEVRVRMDAADGEDAAIMVPRMDDPRLDLLERRGEKWVVLSSDGEQVLGEHDTKEAALAQLRAIEASKRFRETATTWDYRVHAPGDFDLETLGLLDVSRGVRAVVGTPVWGGAMQIQALIFDKQRFSTLESAAGWLRKNPIQGGK